MKRISVKQLEELQRIAIGPFSFVAWSELTFWTHPASYFMNVGMLPKSYQANSWTDSTAGAIESIWRTTSFSHEHELLVSLLDKAEGRPLGFEWRDIGAKDRGNPRKVYVVLNGVDLLSKPTREYHAVDEKQAYLACVALGIGS